MGNNCLLRNENRWWFQVSKDVHRKTACRKKSRQKRFTMESIHHATKCSWKPMVSLHQPMVPAQTRPSQALGLVCFTEVLMIADWTSPKQLWTSNLQLDNQRLHISQNLWTEMAFVVSWKNAFDPSPMTLTCVPGHVSQPCLLLLVGASHIYFRSGWEWGTQESNDHHDPHVKIGNHGLVASLVSQKNSKKTSSNHNDIMSVHVLLQRTNEQLIIPSYLPHMYLQIIDLCLCCIYHI